MIDNNDSDNQDLIVPDDYVAPGPTKIYWIIDLWFLIDWFIIKIQMIDNNDSDNQDLIVPDDCVVPGLTTIFWMFRNTITNII